MVDKKLIYNNEIAESASHALQGGIHGFEAVPGLISKIIEEECWRERYDSQRRKLMKCESFTEFVTARPPKGLGSDMATLERLCHKDQELVEQLRRIKAGDTKPMPEQQIGKGKPGTGRGNKTTDKVSRFSYGNDADYLTARIARDHPVILEEMKEGKYPSVRAAAKAAGIVRELTTVEKMQKLWLKMTPEEKEAFQMWAIEQVS